MILLSDDQGLLVLSSAFMGFTMNNDSSDLIIACVPQVAFLEQQFYENPRISLTELELPVNAVATAIKNFLSALPEALVPSHIFDNVVRVRLLFYSLVNLEESNGRAYDEHAEDKDESKCSCLSMFAEGFATFGTKC